jgi:DNA polymerase-3 subunit beta
MTCSSAEVSLNSQPADQFPGIIFDLEGVSMKFPVSEFRTTINRTYFAATAEKSRFELDGVKLDFTEEGLFWISTDGKRLSSVSASVEGIEVSELSALIPAKAMVELSRIMPNEGDVTITIGENKIAFICPNLKVVSSLLVDNFPPYKQIIPKDYRQRVAIERDVLAQAVRRASILSHEKTNLVKLSFKPGELIVSGERYQVGDAFSTIPMEYKGEDFEAGYKSEFLLDILRVIDTEKITMEWMQPSSPVVIRPYEDETFLHVIMPIKLSDVD